MARVLIVDDDRTTVDLLKTLLQFDGFDVATARDGASAMSRAHDFQPDAFLVDYHLADGDGTDLVEALRGDATFSQTPIIVASGMEREQEALASGADAFLPKPFDPLDLIALLNNLLNGR
ncbi:MAG TPA: response regulator [Aggregatilineales bacterium]|nr:response regulator [Chloroflexota bacterium]HPV06512.1 response regulator [Aggregatilineales bacterium]HQA68207.1 response regulator [Aggregatilineales bacterium]HQE18687.1 response regulator [Aggregatilineales bacterium]